MKLTFSISNTIRFRFLAFSCVSTFRDIDVIKQVWRAHVCNGVIEINQKGYIRCKHPARCFNCRMVDAGFDCGLRRKGSPHNDGMGRFRDGDLESISHAIGNANVAMGMLVKTEDVAFFTSLLQAMIAQSIAKKGE